MIRKLYKEVKFTKISIHFALAVNMTTEPLGAHQYHMDVKTKKPCKAVRLKD